MRSYIFKELQVAFALPVVVVVALALLVVVVALPFLKTMAHSQRAAMPVGARCTKPLAVE